MARRVVAWALIAYGLAAFGWIVASTLMAGLGLHELRWHHSVAAVAGPTATSIGGVLLELGRPKHVAVLMLVATLLLDIVIVLTALRYFRMWEIAALVLGVLMMSAAGLLHSERRERVLAGIMTAIAVPGIFLLAGLIMLRVDAPWF